MTGVPYFCQAGLTGGGAGSTMLGRSVDGKDEVAIWNVLLQQRHAPTFADSLGRRIPRYGVCGLTRKARGVIPL